MIVSKYYYINDIPIQIRYLPSGDIAIWHPFNIEIAEIISSFCRGYGHWEGQYKNWIVFAAFKESVITAIENRSDYNG